MVMVPYLAKAPGGDANSVGSDEPPHDFLFSRVVPTDRSEITSFIFNYLAVFCRQFDQQQPLSRVRQKATVDVGRRSQQSRKMSTIGS